jgi:two-component system response regulator AtoC
MQLKILIIDDDNLVSASLKKALLKLGYDVQVCLKGGESYDYIKRYDPDIILLDIYLTTHNGIELLADFRKSGIKTPIIMITGYADVNIAVKAIKSGAQDFLLKPIDLEQLKIILGKNADKILLSREVNRLESILEEDVLTRDFFGKSKNIQKILTYAERVGQSPDTTVLIEGESGTGKEMISKYLHQNSPRNAGRFIQINCAAIPKELAESELFGHEKGAFTGAAQKTKLGKFELADGGTILLDEVADLSLEMQVKLLRVLQEKNFYRVGGEKEISVNVRVIAATNKSLEQEVKNGNFREDLFYRLNVAYIKMPSLRERKADIPLLAYSFLNEFISRFQSEKATISSAAMDMIKSYSWKGNIRELRNVIERAVLLMEGDELKPEDLSIQNTISSGKSIIDSDEFVLNVPSSGIKIDVVLKKLIEDTLKITDGNQVQAAKVLGLSRSKLRYRMEQLGIHLTKTIN